MHLLAAIELTSVLFAAGAALAILILLKRSAGYFGKRGAGGHITQVSRPNKMLNSIDEARGSREFDRFEVRMHELMREHDARLDSKMLALQALLREADETIAKLDDATNRAKNVDE